MLYGLWFLQQDDAYIFYSYAQNLADGHGYVFNPGERVNATTSPLYTVLLAFLYSTFRFLPFVSLPLIGHLIGAISLFLLCIFLLRTFAGERTSVLPYLFPLVFLANPMLIGAVGMEMFLAMMLGMWSIACYAKGERISAAWIGAVAVLARPDMILLAAVMAGYDQIFCRRMPTMGTIIAFFAPVLPWIGFSMAYFGTFIPTTLSAKLAQTGVDAWWGSGPVFLKGLVLGNAWNGGPGLGAVMAIALILGLLVMVSRRRQWEIFRSRALHVILLWNLAYLLTYAFVLNAPAYEWYYAPLALGTSLIIALPLESVYRWLSRSAGFSKASALSLIIAILIVLCALFPLVGTRQPPTATFTNYKRAAEWLNDHAAIGATVGSNCIGVLRFYYKKGSVLDGVGLVDDAILDHVKRGEFDWYIRYYKPDYLVFQHPPYPLVEEMVYAEWFQSEYALKTIFRKPGHAAAIYERKRSDVMY